MLQLRGKIWQIRLTLPDGTEHRQSAKTENRALAQKLHDKVKTEIWEGRFIKPRDSGMTLQRAFDRLMQQRWSKTKSALTVEFNYQRLLKYVPSGTKLDDITRALLWEVIAEMREDEYADSTINRSLAVVSTILKVARDDWEILQKIPVVPMLEEGKGRLRWLKEGEEKLFTEFFRSKGDYDMADLIEVLLDTGCRVSEILNLRSSDVHIKERRLYLGITKSGEEEYQPLTEFALQIFLRRYKIGSSPFEGLTRHAALKRFRTAKSYFGYENDHELVLHTMRHTCASRLVQQGLDLKRIQAYMRHKDINTTMIYAKLATKENAKTAHELDRMRASGSI